MKRLSFLKSQSWSWRVHVVLISFTILAVLFGISQYLFVDRGHEVKSNRYFGTMEADGVVYDVIILESWWSDGEASRVVKLNPQNGPYSVGFAGDQWDCRVNGWDRIFYGGQLPYGCGVEGGCDSVVRDGVGWKYEKFERRLAGEGEIKPFTEAQIFHIMSLLDRAMEEFHNDKYFADGYRWNEEKRECVRIYSRS
jgi:hypothetical protein